MTREEEIEQASELAYPYSNGVFTDGMRDCFINGAKWADEHLRKGLWDAEKVINWLKANIDNYANYNVKTDECFVNDFEEDLRKAMGTKP